MRSFLSYFSICCEEYTSSFFFFFQAEDGIRDKLVTGVQTCALPILGQRAAHLAPHVGAQPRRQRPLGAVLADDRRQVAPVHELHGQEVLAVLLAEFEQDRKSVV